MIEDNRERYINPYTDFGFKRLFGTEMNKDLLISFLNSLFSGHEEITDITYRNSEQLGSGELSRKAIFDVYCQNKEGEYFIVEMQKAEQDYFKDRSIFYATFPIREQAKRGEWDFNLKGVYTVGILDFVFPDDEYPDECLHHEVKLMDTKDKHVFYDKLTFVYLEMPKFNKREDELVTMFDKWLYALRNLTRLMERPAALQERIFSRLFEQAEIAKLNSMELFAYEESVKVYRDLINVVRTAERKAEARAEARGRAEGRAQGRNEGIEETRKDNARRMKADGMDISLIAKYTGLREEEIDNLT
jgi:predicted transposase/invertase (TIGR01784 family)